MSMSNTEKRVKDIRRNTRRKFSSEEKIRIVLDGLQGVLLSIGRAYAQITCPVLEDLEKKSSFLARLKNDVQLALDNGLNDQSVARRVIFGQQENYVPVAPPFLRDPDAKQVVDCGHTKVFKPSKKWDKPYKHLLKSIDLRRN